MSSYKAVGQNKFIGLALALATACGDDVATGDAGIRAGDDTPATSISTSTRCVPTPARTASPARCSDDSSDVDLPPCEQWEKVEPPNAVCSDGSPYKFFVSYAKNSDNLVVMFEPGGACWDYASCSGSARGAANPNGIPDNHMESNQYLNLLRRTEDNPLHDWNFVFVPYCTGDVHSGDKIATYENPDGGPALTYRHVGLSNTQQVIHYLQTRFPSIPQLFVTGCSAGGVGAIENYAFVRDGLSGTQCSYLLNDSGPAFDSQGPSKQLQDIVREAWNLETLIGRLSQHLGVDESEFANFGRLNTALAERYPNDRLAFTTYRMDFNFSLYLYERFFPSATPEDIHALFWMDLSALLNTYDEHDNLAYFVPYFRRDDCSHCVSIPPIDHDLETTLAMPWLGSDIPSMDVDLRAFIVRLIDDSQPLQSYLEAPRAGADFTSDQLMVCLDPTS